MLVNLINSKDRNSMRHMRLMQVRSVHKRLVQWRQLLKALMSFHIIQAPLSGRRNTHTAPRPKENSRDTSTTAWCASLPTSTAGLVTTSKSSVMTEKAGSSLVWSAEG